MKRFILLFLSVMMTVIMTAGDVTPQQALQQAQKFLQQTPSGMKRSQVEVPQLKMAGRVSGLYVFNAEANQGYVIVSNDDRTTPILGYSETGTLDPDNMPCNMRAWLQGYADEIAWLNEHNYQPAASQAPHRTASAVKEPIAPLMATKWNQDYPYNAFCPEYSSGKKCATGCVATAMAQCMYFTEMRVGSTTTTITSKIPGYTNPRYGLTINAIPAGTTIKWSDMIADYSKGYTSEEATAVAYLMLYCGTSVQMNYGPESSSNGDKVANALKSYFDYNTGTVTFIDRNDYTYSDWVDIMYYELSQGRPVCYGGQSSGGGHEFVCDGYQNEDYFHINWGWGGMSDNYFKLSALDSDQQGIGGSTSTDGFNYGQDAVIGIQKAGETGTLPPLNINNPSYTINSLTLDKSSILGGESVEASFEITVKPGDDFDRDLHLYDLNGKGFVAGKTFYAKAGTTKICTFTFTPENETHVYNLTIFYPSGGYYYYCPGSFANQTLSVTATSANPTTDNITLTSSLTVENSENAGGVNYNLYGKEVNGVLRVNNPNASYDYSGVFQFDVYIYGNYSSPVWRYVDNVLIPANGYIDIPVAFSGILGKKYDFTFIYDKNGGSSGWIGAGYYTIQPGITAYKSDGTYTVVKSTTNYEVPADAVAVDMSGAGVTNVTKNSNPNTLYILKKSDSVPGSLNNVVTLNNDGSYSSKDITLTDGYDFYSPVDFTATDIEFTYSNDRWADGTNGWNTIMLPFDVTSVTANGTDIDWFHSGSDTGKQFWLKKFTGDDTSAPKVYFDYTDEMKANTPYIIALPGNHWGTEYDLSGKTIKFIGANAEVKKSTPGVVTGNNYRFVGDTKAVTIENIYCINSDDNQFVLKKSGGSPAFRPFFKADMFDRTVTSLGIGNGGETTGITTLNTERETLNDDSWYDLQGRRIENPTKGVYIKNGRLFIKK